MKYFPIVAVALFLDGLQGMITLSFAALGFALQGMGAAAGAVPVAGTILAGLAGMSGMAVLMLGVVISTTISMVFGAGFITLLTFSKLASLRQLLTLRRGPFLIAKFVPFINAIPFFTTLALTSIMYKRREEKKILMRANPQAGEETEEIEAEAAQDAISQDERDEEDEEATEGSTTQAPPTTERAPEENLPQRTPLQDIPYRPSPPVPQNQSYAPAV